MTQSLCLKLFIKGAFVGSWGRKQALEDSHQEAGQKVLSKATLGLSSGGGGREAGEGSLRHSLPWTRSPPSTLFDQEMPEQLIVCCRD